MRIKLLAIDIDGTLLDDHHRLSERTKKALLEAKERGIKLILATGRGPRSCDHLVELLDLTDPLITHNGAVIYHPDSNRAENQVGFQAAELKPILDYCRKRNIHFDANTAFQLFTEHIREEYLPIYKRYYAEPIEIDDVSCLNEPVVKLTMADYPERLNEVYGEITSLFPDWSIIRSGETFIDVMHPEATKGNALQYLLQEYDIQPNEVMAFGNYYNDLTMLQLAGIGVAMGNAPKEIRKQADLVTETNNREGVAQVIENLLKLEQIDHLDR